SRGASATLTFTARRVVWNGPTGPTRGKAKIYVDGRYIRTVDLRRGSFDARASLYRTSWSKSGRHTLKILVVGTRGRPMVAIDDFAVTP
ncbi:MAG: N-acetylmuramoyl-L-alanine amidase, partial [Candidatus Limnocylindrales bacterium]